MRLVTFDRLSRASAQSSCSGDLPKRVSRSLTLTPTPRKWCSDPLPTRTSCSLHFLPVFRPPSPLAAPPQHSYLFSHQYSGKECSSYQPRRQVPALGYLCFAGIPRVPQSCPTLSQTELSKLTQSPETSNSKMSEQLCIAASTKRRSRRDTC